IPPIEHVLARAFSRQTAGKAHKSAHAGQQKATDGASATNPVHSPAKLPHLPLQEQRRAQEYSPDDKPKNAESPLRPFVPAEIIDEAGSPFTGHAIHDIELFRVLPGLPEWSHR